MQRIGATARASHARKRRGEDKMAGIALAPRGFLRRTCCSGTHLRFGATSDARDLAHAPSARGGAGADSATHGDAQAELKLDFNGKSGTSEVDLHRQIVMVGGFRLRVKPP